MKLDIPKRYQHFAAVRQLRPDAVIPWKLLYQERAIPMGTDDAINLDDHYAEGELRVIKLTCYSEHKHSNWLISAWKSAGWELIPVKYQHQLRSIEAAAKEGYVTPAGLGVHPLKYEHRAVVRKRQGYFPFDMLRYDSCFVESPLPVERKTSEATVVKFTSQRVASMAWTAARWASFGWELIPQ